MTHDSLSWLLCLVFTFPSRYHSPPLAHNWGLGDSTELLQMSFWTSRHIWGESAGISSSISVSCNVGFFLSLLSVSLDLEVSLSSTTSDCDADSSREFSDKFFWISPVLFCLLFLFLCDSLVTGLDFLESKQKAKTLSSQTLLILRLGLLASTSSLFSCSSISLSLFSACLFSSSSSSANSLCVYSSLALFSSFWMAYRSASTLLLSSSYSLLNSPGWLNRRTGWESSMTSSDCCPETLSRHSSGYGFWIISHSSILTREFLRVWYWVHEETRRQQKGQHKFAFSTADSKHALKSVVCKAVSQAQWGFPHRCGMGIPTGRNGAFGYSPFNMLIRGIQHQYQNARIGSTGMSLSKKVLWAR